MSTFTSIVKFSSKPQDLSVSLFHISQVAFPFLVLYECKQKNNCKENLPSPLQKSVCGRQSFHMPAYCFHSHIPHCSSQTVPRECPFTYPVRLAGPLMFSLTWRRQFLSLNPLIGRCRTTEMGLNSASFLFQCFKCLWKIGLHAVHTGQIHFVLI